MDTNLTIEQLKQKLDEVVAQYNDYQAIITEAYESMVLLSNEYQELNKKLETLKNATK